jgi:hypothetical protein
MVPKTINTHNLYNYSNIVGINQVALAKGLNIVLLTILKNILTVNCLLTQRVLIFGIIKGVKKVNLQYIGASPFT